MMSGELEYEALFPQDPADNPPPFEYYSNLLFVVFVLVMGIVVMNLLVGLAVDDIQEIQENAELHQLSLNVSGKDISLKADTQPGGVGPRLGTILPHLRLLPLHGLPRALLQAEAPAGAVH